MNYSVTIDAQISYNVYVEADSQEDAEEKAQERFEIKLSFNDISCEVINSIQVEENG